MPDITRLEAAITSHTRAITLNSPNNPSGSRVLVFVSAPALWQLGGGRDRGPFDRRRPQSGKSAT